VESLIMSKRHYQEKIKLYFTTYFLYFCALSLAFIFLTSVEISWNVEWGNAFVKQNWLTGLTELIRFVPNCSTSFQTRKYTYKVSIHIISLCFTIYFSYRSKQETYNIYLSHLAPIIFCGISWRFSYFESRNEISSYIGTLILGTFFTNCTHVTDFFNNS
jgi:hypothetical protein